MGNTGADHPPRRRDDLDHSKKANSERDTLAYADKLKYRPFRTKSGRGFILEPRLSLNKSFGLNSLTLAANMLTRVNEIPQRLRLGECDYM
jgi:hypothetical protein